MEFAVEMGPDRPPTRCACCESETRMVHGYVYRDDAARAVYYAAWTTGHPDEGVQFSIGLGDWGQGVGPEHRVAFTLEYRTGKGGGFSLQDASRFVREEAVILGRPMDREEDLSHRFKEELFSICEVLLKEDRRIREFLSSLPGES